MDTAGGFAAISRRAHQSAVDDQCRLTFHVRWMVRSEAAVRAGEPLNVNGFWHRQPPEPSVFLTPRRPGSVCAGGLDGLEDATHGLLGEFRQVVCVEAQFVEPQADPRRSFVGVGLVGAHHGSIPHRVTGCNRSFTAFSR